ncbi:hypothetical protein CY34DRAFT_41835, partial [Suillus luteus UH-Slu-Lm8-n1]
SDLDDVIELHRAALGFYPYSYSDRSTSSPTTFRFEQHGALSDLDEAIQLHRAAL